MCEGTRSGSDPFKKKKLGLCSNGVVLPCCHTDALTSGKAKCKQAELIALPALSRWPCARSRLLRARHCAQASKRQS